jgi:iron complex outermembrane receptor protein
MKSFIKPIPRKKTLALYLAAITTAMIQTPSIYAQDDANIEEITVTGSRIRMTDGMAAPTPVTVVTPEELNAFDPGGSVSEQLDALPQFFGTVTPQRNVGSVASSVGSFLNMRSLGSKRTLVLLDGARMAPGDKRGAVNVDTFPTALVRTVDVVTGGASAAYGADALGGVTNFIIDREFEGLKIQTGTGIMETGDGLRYNMSVAGGFQIGDRMNVIGSVEARSIDQIDLGPNDMPYGDWYQRWGWVQNPDPNGPRRLTKPNVVATDRHVNGVISGTRTELDGMIFNSAGTQVMPFGEGENFTRGRGTLGTTAGGREADWGYKANSGYPINGQEVKGRSLFLAVNYEFTDQLSGYAQAVVGRSESNHKDDRPETSGIALRSIWAPRVAVDNAYLPEYVRDTMIANGIDQFVYSRDGSVPGTSDWGSDSRDPNVNNSRTYTLGFDYDFGNSWTLGGSFSMGETDRLSHNYQMNRVDRMFLSMDAVVHPDTGAIVCRVNLPQYSPTEEQLRAAGLASGRNNSRTENGPVSGFEPLASPVGLDNTVGGCIPHNVLGHGNMSPEVVEYTGSVKKGVGLVEQDFAELLATGELYEGWGYGPVSGAFGLTWRDSGFSDNAQPELVDALGPPLNVPDLGIRGIPPGYTGGSPNLHKFSTVPKVSGQYDVWEWFAEVNAPIWESDNGEQRIGATAAYRQSEYSTSGKVDAWKVGAEFQVMEGLRFRATQSQDVREANFSERFDAQGGGGNINDPWIDDNYTITTVRAGNPNVSPETADTSVFGFVYEPQFEALEGLSLSVDWYEVEIAGAISQIGHQDVVDRCFAGIQEQCANIEFDPNGQVTRVFRRFFNQDQAIVEGLDFEVAYRMEPNFFDSQFETFSVRALAGKLLTRQDISRTGRVTELLDQYNLPIITGNVTASYGVGPWSFQVQGRYIDGGIMEDNWTEGVDVDDNTVPSSLWWNGTFRYSGEMNNGSTWNVGLNILNIGNKAPPIIPGNLGNQGANNMYDVYGRRYNLSLNLEF